MDSDEDEREEFRVSEYDLENEFRPRGGRKFTRNDATYGVFRESDSDGEGDMTRRKRKNFVDPVNFVKSAKAKPASSTKGKARHPPSDGQRDSGADDDDGVEEEEEEEEEGNVQGSKTRRARGGEDDDDDENDDDDEEDGRSESDDERTNRTILNREEAEEEERIGARSGFGAPKLLARPPGPREGSQPAVAGQLPIKQPAGPPKPKTTDPFAKLPASSTAVSGSASTVGGKGKTSYSVFRSNSKTKDKDLATWERHTKGFGSKMLEKMGWKGHGLGVEEQGIATPIDAGRVRRRGEALQDHGERANKGMTDKDKEKEKEADPEEAFQQHLAQWRVTEPSASRARKPKYVFKTAEELAKEAKSSMGSVAPSAVKVIDMSGPETRVLDGYDQIRTGTAGAFRGIDKHVPMAELQHNVRLLVDLAAADVQRLSGRINREVTQQSGLRQEEVQIGTQIAREAAFIDTLEEIMATMERCRQRIDSPSNPLTLPECVEIFAQLKKNHDKEYTLYGLAALALSLVLPLVRRALLGWFPLRSPHSPVAMFQTWHELLQGSDHVDTSGARFDPTVELREYERLCWEALMPCFRTAFISEWNPRDAGSALTLMEAWQGLLPGWIVHNIGEQLVLPRLQVSPNVWWMEGIIVSPARGGGLATSKERCIDMY